MAIKVARMKDNQCFSCTIGIGKGHIEPLLYSVGDKKICWWCKNELEHHKYLKIISEEKDGVECRAVYLYQDGSTQEAK